MFDWENACNTFPQYHKLDILNLGLSYCFDKEQSRERILIKDGDPAHIDTMHDTPVVARIPNE